MKITFKVEYSKREREEDNRNDFEIVIPNLRDSASHFEITRYYYGFLTSMGYILPLEVFELIED